MSRGWQDTADVRAVVGDPFPDLCRKILLVVATDEDVLASFQPMVAILRECAREVVVVTRTSVRRAEFESLGVRTVDFAERNPSDNAVEKAASIWRLACIIEAEEPDVVHLVGPRPAMLGALAFKLKPATAHIVVHATGPGPFGIAEGWLSRIKRAATLRLVAALLREPSSCLLVESASDLVLLRGEGIDPGPRFAILGGMGIDPQEFPSMAPPDNASPVAAFVGRMSRCNGVDLLLQACDRVAGRGLHMMLELCGDIDRGEANSINRQEMQDWCARGGGRWHRHVADVRDVWRNTDICVLPARHGGGLPRTVLQAAACARPLIVTDVPGLVDFVRDGVEGLVVPNGDPAALAEALQQLVRDPDLRERMGEAARLRVLQGHTRIHLRTALRGAYQSLLGKTAAR